MYSIAWRRNRAPNLSFLLPRVNLKKALDRISTVLKAQYTLAYYPQNVDKLRKIEVKVNRGGVKVSARRSVGSNSASEAVHFIAAGCQVSPDDHPYAWESRVTSNGSRAIVYHEDFSDSRSGWPNRRFDWNTLTSAHYVAGGYELSRTSAQTAMPFPATQGVIAAAADTAIATYGPWWEDFRASALMEGSWDDPNSAFGLVFDVMEGGYYGFLLTAGTSDQIAFEVIKGRWDGTRSAMIPRTLISSFEHPGKVHKHKLSVECNRGQINLLVDDQHVATVLKPGLKYGFLGFGIFGNGRVIVHDLLVEAIR